MRPASRLTFAARTGVALLVLAPWLAARADNRPLEGVGSRGITLSVSGGYAAPEGDLVPGSSLSSSVRREWPLRVATGHRFTSAVRASLFLQLAPVTAQSSASGGFSYDFLLGGELSYRFFTHTGIEPWAGLGAGVELLSFERGSPVQHARTEAFGWVFPIVRAGVDYRLSPNLAAGPVAGLTLGRFTRVDLESPTTPGVFTRSGGSWHHWLDVGVQATLDL